MEEDAASAAATSLHLPSLHLSASGGKVELVHKFAELNQRVTPLDYIPDDSEARARQCRANNGVRDLLRELPRLKQNVASVEAPDYISLKEGGEDDAELRQPAVVVDLDTDDNTPSSSSASSALDALRHSAATRAAGVTEAPWLYFLGHSPRPDAPLADWRKVLEQLTRQQDFFGRIHEEICALCLWLDQSPEELLLRQRVIARVETVCKLLWPDCRVTTFGSYYTGLTLPNGDIDVNVALPGGGAGGAGQSIRALRLLTVCLNRLGIPHGLEVISGARVPIVKMVDAETGVSVDISFNTHSALSTSNFVVESIKQYPWLRPLILLLKLFLQQRGMNETFRGGVGSYLLFCLVLSFLQQHKLTNSETFRERANLGHLLFDFFQLYGRDFDYETTGISVNNGGQYFLKTRYNSFNRERPWLLCMESPLATDQDIGKSSYEIRTVRNAFRQSFLALAEMHATRCLQPSLLVASGVIFLSDPLLTNRVRVPVQYTGASAVEQTEWWQSVKSCIGLPVGCPRSAPKLPASVLRQVREELERVHGGLAALTRDYAVREKQDALERAKRGGGGGRRNSSLERRNKRRRS